MADTDDAAARETVLITGCSSGIGRATALAFLEEGWTVYATARDTADVAELGDARHCETARLDVTEDEDVERVVDRIVDEQGRIDCLVNNAGYGQYGAIEDVPVDDVHAQFDVNVYGPHRLTRAVLPHMREREDGTIVNVSSVLGRLSIAGSGVYSGSKFALEAMSDALRAEVDGHGIDVVLVEPGPVDTGFDDRAADEIDDVERSGAYDTVYEVFDDVTALGGDGPGSVPPEEVAAYVVNAASSTRPAARYPVGALAALGVYARFLPDRWRDALYRLVSRLV